MGVFNTSAGEDDECLFMSSFLFPVSSVLAAKEGYWLLVGLAGMALASREDGDVLWQKLDILGDLGKADLLLPPLSSGEAAYAVSGFVDGRLRITKLVATERTDGTATSPDIRLEHTYSLAAPDFASQGPPPDTAASRQRAKHAPADEGAATPHAPCCLAWSGQTLVALTDGGEAIVYQTPPACR